MSVKIIAKKARTGRQWKDKNGKALRCFCGRIRPKGTALCERCRSERVQ